MAYPPDSDGDQLLIGRVQGGDSAALAMLYDRYGRSLMGVAIRILGNPTDAEDLLQDVFFEVWHKARSYDPTRTSVRAWLFLRLRSRAIDRKRSLTSAGRSGLIGIPMDADEVNQVPAVDDPSTDPDRHRARRAMSLLPESQRQVLQLGYFDGLTYPEIAARCRIPVGTVKSRLSAALARLRQELGTGGERA